MIRKTFFLFTLIFRIKILIDQFACLLLLLNISLMPIEEVDLKELFYIRIIMKKKTFFFLPCIKRNIYSKNADNG